MSIGEKILEIRERKGITRKELAQMLEVSLATITRYERGDRKPNIEILTQIALALGTPVSELIPDPPSNGLTMFKTTPSAVQIYKLSDPNMELRHQAIDKDLELLTTGFNSKLESFNQNLEEYIRLDDLEFFKLFLEKFKIDSSNIDEATLSDLKEKVVSYATFLISSTQTKEGE